ncbi:glycosyltransferase family 4 protein [filamentous cyanobacterium LEGE 11480]|uniref:Glycosyltransferase family 4 protein n=1 Tax=Romeriopsis navalis LEGE 11480 TaxID=2777977 RepID=A0A928Z426_9CYAN|nr:glycosyltransferase family 1 protein [Romeriopsis navalis]MBE9030602.1 glycosyltransferase family 4 protein [Romeriopsis navalis LEGE 11480]
MINLAYDHQAFCLSPYGGITRYVYELASRSASLDSFDVKILAGLYTNNYVKRDQKSIVRGLQIPTVPKTAQVLRLINSGLVGAYLQYKTPNIVHETYYSQRRIAPKSCQTVLTVYDMIHEKFGHMMPRREQRIVDAKRSAIERADHIICISEQTKRDLIETFDVIPEKLSVVHLGFSLTQNKNSDSLPIVGQPYILYVGSRRSYKNFSGLVHAYAASKEINQDIALVCFGSQAFSDSERELFQELGLNQNQVIHLSGDDNVLGHLYANAEAFIYPSLYEGFGIPPLEAMSFDCPVICSNGGSIPEIVGDAGVYFDPNSLSSIVNSLKMVLLSPLKQANLVELGKQRLTRFSWEKCAIETQNIYQGLLAKN